MAVLVASAQAGDRGAFDELVRRTTPGTFTLARRLCGDPDDAADVVQDTYLRAYRSLRRFRGDAAFTTWLHATTNHTVDIVLALLMIVGGVIGAQFGTQIGVRMKAEQLRVLLALLVLIVCFKLGLELVLKPAELYSLAAPGGH